MSLKQNDIAGAARAAALCRVSSAWNSRSILPNAWRVLLLFAAVRRTACCRASINLVLVETRIPK